MAAQSSLASVQKSKQQLKKEREEAKKRATAFINKYAIHETAKRSSDFVNGSEYNRINSILAGRETGHELIGEKYGREGALGALAAKDKNIKMQDVYTRENIVARAKQGFVKDVGGGALLGTAAGFAAGATQTGQAHGINMLTGALIGAGLGATAGLLKTAHRSLIEPGWNFYRGKKAAELESVKKKYGVE